MNYWKLLAVLIAAAVAGCGGASVDDPSVLNLPSGQMVTATTEIYANMMPMAGDRPECNTLEVAATFVSSPGPAPDYLVPTNVSLFSGVQLLWSGAFDSARTQLDSSGHLKSVAIDCVGFPIAADWRGRLVSARITLNLNGSSAEIVAPPSALEISF